MNRFGKSIRRTLYCGDKVVDNLEKYAVKYIWTNHSQYKMRCYSLSPQRIKRIIRYPLRVEEAIVSGLVAVMAPSGSKKYSEIWAMYKPIKQANSKSGQIKVITAWKYPGKSPARNPIPREIMEEIKSSIF